MTCLEQAGQGRVGGAREDAAVVQERGRLVKRAQRQRRVKPALDRASIPKCRQRLAATHRQIIKPHLGV